VEAGRFVKIKRNNVQIRFLSFYFIFDHFPMGKYGKPS